MSRNAPSVTIDGVTFTVNEAMLRTASRRKKLVTASALGVVISAASALGQLGTLARGMLIFLSTILGVVPALHYIFGKRLSSRSAGIFIPLVMKGVDAQYSRVRAELILRTMRGRVLDVGSGGGAYLKYAFATTAHRVTEVVALEPNVHAGM